MGILTNMVTEGAYKDRDVRIKGLGRKVVLVSRFLGLEQVLDKKTVDHIELLDKAQGVLDFVGMNHYLVAVYFKNGKKCIIRIEYYIYQRLNEVLF